MFFSKFKTFRPPLGAVLAGLGFFLLSASAQAGIKTVWAVNDSEKVERDDLNNPQKGSNSVWDGQSIRLFAARNEVVAFQVIVEADANGISALSAALPELTDDSSHSLIRYSPPNLDPSLTIDRPIQLFAENYLLVTAPTTADWIVPASGPARPTDMTGWKPVQLVPENATVGKGGFPVQVAASQNQAFWFEIYTGWGHPAGHYQGIVEIRDGQSSVFLPVDLELLDFTLPNRNSLQAMIYFESEQVVLYQGSNLDDSYHRFAHRQRIELVNAVDIATAIEHHGRFDGSDFWASRGYEGPGEGVGNILMPASFYWPGTGYDVRSTAWQQSDQWMNFLNSHFPGAITFLYMPDEPGPADYPQIHTIAGNLHSNPGPGRTLPVFVTHSYTPDLDNDIDIWCAFPGDYNLALAARERQLGRQYWIYNGMRPYSGAILIDSPAADSRVNPWICFKHDIPVYFYWHSVHWEHNSQKPSNRIQNIWANPVTFDNRGQAGKPADYGAFANGDGVLIYPGQERLHPEEDRGIPGPCASFQLANLRRGLQDHLYLTLARGLGLESEVAQALGLVVPQVLSQSTGTIGFAQTGNTFEQARSLLGKAIERETVARRNAAQGDRRNYLPSQLSRSIVSRQR
jgi:hypothetical protein